ncbi:helix-turn-helix domain-containing protein [Streptomyces sp. NPDC091259]|uniref:helix-turn-helix domain-containing protein n=1 Tax=Streptomyces sp. NPDC091259 TaxID=3365976 RepID=UPI00382710F0
MSSDPATPDPLGPSRSADIRALHRLAHVGGSAALLRWLTTRLGGWAGVVDVAGGDGPRESGTPHVAVRAAAEMAARSAGSAVLHDDGSAALLFALDERRALAAVLDLPHHPGAPALLADAAVPLALVLAAEEARVREERARLAESRAREAVLHLLMNGRISTARQVAATLSPVLPEPVRIYVVECRSGERPAAAAVCERLTGGRAWTVHCPVYVRHLIVLVPADLAADQGGSDHLAGALVELARDCVVGVSAQAHLRQLPTAYGQAFHALAVARGRAARHARFGPGPELELAAHDAAAGWAEALLAPLHGYAPRRPQDPGPQELRATAHAWLDFASYATRLLKIHRNTLATRIRLVESVLGLDLARLADQSALSLALRLIPAGGRRTGLPAAEGPTDLDGVLRHPDLVAWSRAHLGPLTGPGAPAGAWETVRTWLRHDARLAPAAEALGLSLPGARKRLTRVEELMERSLLRSPSARYDLWLAHRAEELDRGSDRGHSADGRRNARNMDDHA